MKNFIYFMIGLCTGVFAVMLYLHKGVIKAMITGEEMPEAPEGCPAFKCDE